MDRGSSEATAENVESAVAVSLVVTGLWVLWRPRLVPCAWIAAWLLVLAIATNLQGGAPHAELAPIAHAARFGAPIGLWLWSRGRRGFAEGVLRVCIAATFAAHGYEALQHSPRFIDILIPFGRRHFDLRLTEAEARQVLTVIGAVDVLAALAVLATRLRSIAAYMAVWGLATALSRPMAWGLEFWPEATQRVANAGIPLALLIYWTAMRRARFEEHDSSPTP